MSVCVLNKLRFGNAEISNPSIAIFLKDDVLWFEIFMNYMIRVDILKADKDTCGYEF